MAEFQYLSTAALTYKRRGTTSKNKRATNFAGMIIDKPVVGGFPTATLTQLRYVDRIQINPSTEQVAYYTYRTNGVFDPDQSGTGHQPLGYDTWSEIYNHTCVLRSHMKCTFVSTETGTQVGLCVGAFIKPMGDALVSSELTTLLENGYSKYRIYGSKDTMQGDKSIQLSFDTRKYFGVHDVVDNDDLCATVGTNPADGANYTIFVGCLGTSDLGAVQFLVELTYDVLFMETKQLGQN